MDFNTSGNIPKVMLIDDNSGEVIILKAALKRISTEQVDFEAYQNPITALEHLQELSKTANGKKDLPNLILLDLNMPEMNGTEILKILKADELLRVIPIVIMTTSSIEEELKKCYDLFANSVMQKPMDFDDYVKMLDTITVYWFSFATNIEVK